MEKPLILIVGAGPTGLFFAHQMMSRGHAVRVIDKKSGLSDTSRAIALHIRTLEILDKVGMLEDFRRKAFQGNVEMHIDKRRIIIDFSQVQSPWPHMLFMSQADMENILYHHLCSLGGSVEWGTECIHLNERTCTLRHANGQLETITPEWVIGADGGNSVVRRESGIAFPGQGFHQNFFLADVRGTIELPNKNLHVCLERGEFMLLCELPGNIYRLLFMLGKETQDDVTHLTPKTLLELAQQRTDHVKEIREIIWKSEFKIRTCLAECWRHHNCFLMGDAAHVHSPVGGQGLNMSLQDAWNLSWKLDLAMHHVAAAELLDSYSVERRVTISSILKTTELATGVLATSPHWVREGLKKIMLFVQRFPNIRRLLPNLASQVHGNFMGTRWVSQPESDRKWKGPKPGTRLPYIPMKQGSSFDLWNPSRHVVILFSENPSIAALLEPIASWIEIRVIADLDLKTALRAENDSIYVIRPDGYIGYRSRRTCTESLLQYFQGVFDAYVWQGVAATSSKCTHKKS